MPWVDSHKVNKFQKYYHVIHVGIDTSYFHSRVKMQWVYSFYLSLPLFCI